ncbi:hypothetical protein HX109_10045 [Galbibacter sp. BG1]|uniref:DUF6702 family protein n=1 Tax=Galbibacter sp. BG1 TaxID=1170699 RepID=UPI0015B7A00A|nr:DUF6702 family protein [Galbibacter sp. BG1]QLE01880.1 hypothetical protein HX109_10045 [Galbibacter sp. BG1]
MQSSKKYFILLFILPLLSFGIFHKFYVSVTDVKYSEEDQALQIISRYFIDDMEKLLKERYGVDTKLMTKKELKNADFYIEKYLRDKFVVRIDGEEIAWNFIGKEYDVDVMKCYLEIPKMKPKKIESISIQSRVLFDLYPEQQNVVHISVKDEKKSFMLVKENDKALLKL